MPGVIEMVGAYGGEQSSGWKDRLWGHLYGGSDGLDFGIDLSDVYDVGRLEVGGNRNPSFSPQLKIFSENNSFHFCKAVI